MKYVEKMNVGFIRLKLLAVNEMKIERKVTLLVITAGIIILGILLKIFI